MGMGGIDVVVAGSIVSQPVLEVFLLNGIQYGILVMNELVGGIAGVVECVESHSRLASQVLCKLKPLAKVIQGLCAFLPTPLYLFYDVVPQVLKVVRSQACLLQRLNVLVHRSNGFVDNEAEVIGVEALAQGALESIANLLRRLPEQLRVSFVKF